MSKGGGSRLKRYAAARKKRNKEGSKQGKKKSSGCTKLKLTEQEAQDVVDTASAMRSLTMSKKRKEKRKYYCKPCQGWHTTSK